MFHPPWDQFSIEPLPDGVSSRNMSAGPKGGCGAGAHVSVKTETNPKGAAATRAAMRHGAL